MHDQIVSIDKRLEDGRQRYILNAEITEDEIKVHNALRKMEKYLCELAGINPEDINPQVIKA